MKRSKLAAPSVLLMLSLAMSACGGGTTNGNSNEGGKSTSAVTGTPAAAKTATINVLTQSFEPKELLEKFSKEHPEITVKWEQVSADSLSQTIRTRIASGGDNLDLITPVKADFEPLAKSDAFVDLKGEKYLSSYDSNAIDSGTINGKVVGIPLTQQVYVVWYNKDLFTKHGVTEPKNWDEFLAVSETLKSKGVPPIVLAGKEEGNMTVFAGLVYSGLLSKDTSWMKKVATGKAKWTDPESVDALNKMRLLAEKGYFLDGALGTGDDQSYQAFYQGKAAMLESGAWSIDKIAANTPSFNVGAFIPPANKVGEPLKAAFVPGNTISISSKSKNIEAAKTFLSFISVQENASIWSKSARTFSTVQGTSADFHPAAELLKPIFAAEKSEMIHATVTLTVKSTIGKVFQKLAAKEITAEAAAKELQTAQDKDIK